MYIKEFHIILGVWEFGSILFWDILEYLGYAGYQSVCVGATNLVYSYFVLIYMYYMLYTAAQSHIGYMMYIGHIG